MKTPFSTLCHAFMFVQNRCALPPKFLQWGSFIFCFNIRNVISKTTYTQLQKKKSFSINSVKHRDKTIRKRPLFILIFLGCMSLLDVSKQYNNNLSVRIYLYSVSEQKCLLRIKNSRTSKPFVLI